MMVRQTTVADLEAAPNFLALLDEYANDEALPGLPRPVPNMAIYRRMEDAGMLHVFEAADADGVIGFIVIVTTELPNYSCTMTATDSFFVTRDKRFSGAGLKLLRKAEAKARSLGSPGLGVSASTGSRLAEILPRMGFVESNVVFFKRFDGTHLNGGMNGGA